MLTTRPVRLAWALLTPPTPARPRTSAPSTWFSSNGTALRRVGATRVSEQDLEHPSPPSRPVDAVPLHCAARGLSPPSARALEALSVELPLSTVAREKETRKTTTEVSTELWNFFWWIALGIVYQKISGNLLDRAVPPSILQKKKVRSASQREAKKTEAPPRGERRREGERERSEATRGLIEDGDSVHRLTHLAHLKE